MRLILFLGVLSLTIGVPASGMDAIIPFETAHTTAQSRVTSLMLLEELNQFKSIADWHRTQHQLEIEKARLTKAKSEFDRATKLRKEKVLSNKNYIDCLNAYEKQLIEVSRLEYEVLLAKGTAEIHKMRVLEEGNPQHDYRKEIASALAVGLRVEVASLKERLEVAKSIQQTTKSHFDVGKTLHAHSAISTAELEKRELSYVESVHVSEMLASLSQLSERAAEAFEDNLRNL